MSKASWTTLAAGAWVAEVVQLALLFSACTMSIGIDPSKAGGLGETASAIGAATGNPLLMLLGHAATLGTALFASHKAAKASDKAPLTPEEANNVEAALRAKGHLK